jgi:hypothetical protein
MLRQLLNKPEFPIWTSGSHIVPFARSRHNEFATRTGPNGEALAAKSCEVVFSECGFWGCRAVKFPHSGNPVSQALSCPGGDYLRFARIPLPFRSLIE